jgi:hypothetical protein
MTLSATKAYDVSKFVNEVRVNEVCYTPGNVSASHGLIHPSYSIQGGDLVLLSARGENVTEAFEDVQHSDDAKRMLAQYLVRRCPEARIRLLSVGIRAAENLPEIRQRLASGPPQTHQSTGKLVPLEDLIYSSQGVYPDGPSVSLFAVLLVLSLFVCLIPFQIF